METKCDECKYIDSITLGSNEGLPCLKCGEGTMVKNEKL